MRTSQDLTWSQVVMAANTPMLLKAAMVDGRPDLGVMASGQVVGVIDDLPTVAELVDRIMAEAEAVLDAPRRGDAMTDVQGAVAPGFEAVHDAFAANFAEHGEIGAACCVYRDGEPVVDVWGGLADRDDARSWARDTVVIVFSCTKGVTAVAANQLIERGLLDPDAPVAEYWPEFAQEGKGTIPVAWVLSHRAGLAAIDDPDLTLDDVAAWDPVIDAIAAQAPNWEPGTAHGYHARTYGWMTGELIRRVTGLMPGTYVAQEIAGPLGLDFVIGVPESWEPRVATLYPPVYDDPELARLVGRRAPRHLDAARPRHGRPIGALQVRRHVEHAPHARRASCRRRTGTVTRVRWRGCTPPVSTPSMAFACSRLRRWRARRRFARAASTA